MKRKLLAGILILVMILSVTGCQKKSPVSNSDTDIKQQEEPEPVTEEESSEEEENLPEITVGVCKTLDTLPLFLMQEEGLDRSAGFVLKVEQFDTFAGQSEAVKNGELDGVLTDTASVIAWKGQGTQLRIVGPADMAVSLLAGPKAGVSELSQCRGKMVCMPENTGMEYILDYMLAQNNYVDTFVDKSKADAYETVLQILSEEPDILVVLPEPYAGMARKQGAVELATTAERGPLTFVSAFREEFLTDKAELAAAFQTAYQQAASNLADKTGEEKLSLFASYTGLTDRNPEGTLWSEYRLTQIPSEEDLEDVYYWCQSKGLYEEEFDRNSMVYIPEE